MNLPQVLVKTNHIVLAAPAHHWHIPNPEEPQGLCQGPAEELGRAPVCAPG